MFRCMSGKIRNIRDDLEVVPLDDKWKKII